MIHPRFPAVLSPGQPFPQPPVLIERGLGRCLKTCLREQATSTELTDPSVESSGLHAEPTDPARPFPCTSFQAQNRFIVREHRPRIDRIATYSTSRPLVKNTRAGRMLECRSVRLLFALPLWTRPSWEWLREHCRGVGPHFMWAACILTELHEFRPQR